MLRGIPLAAARLGGLRGSVVDYVIKNKLLNG